MRKFSPYYLLLGRTPPLTRQLVCRSNDKLQDEEEYLKMLAEKIQEGI